MKLNEFWVETSPKIQPKKLEIICLQNPDYDGDKFGLPNTFDPKTLGSNYELKGNAHQK